MGGGSPGLGWGASCCGVCLAVVCGVLLGCVLLWCDVVLYGATQFDEEPFAEAFGNLNSRKKGTLHQGVIWRRGGKWLIMEWLFGTR